MPSPSNLTREARRRLPRFRQAIKKPPFGGFFYVLAEAVSATHPMRIFRYFALPTSLPTSMYLAELIFIAFKLARWPAASTAGDCVQTTERYSR